MSPTSYPHLGQSADVSLEAQTLIPIFGEHPVEMGMAGKEALLFQRLQENPSIKSFLPKPFRNKPSPRKLTLLACYRHQSARRL